jgi:NitT/TauT family transport system substrate-binding protein
MSGHNKLFACLLLVVVLVGCSTASPTEVTSVPPRALKVQLDWLHTIEYAGFYMAEANGYFAEENLSVEFISSDGSISPTNALSSGEVEFAVTGADTLLRARESGEDLVAFATIYQRLPLAFMSLAENNILVPADLVGKTIMLSMDRTSEYAFRAMIQVAGIDISTINLVPREVFDEAPLLNHEVDVMDVFVTNQVVQMNRAGVAVNLILPVDYGVEMYVNTIVTTQALIDAEPEVVAAFTRAITRGFQAAIDDPAAATTATVNMNPDLVYESELESMNSSLPFINPSTSRPGMMSATTWQFIYGMLEEQNILTQEQDIAAAYNLSFLEAIYPSS